MAAERGARSAALEAPRSDVAERPAAHFTRDTATPPPAPDQSSEVELIAARMAGGGRTPEDVARISHGHAVLGTYTAPSGGTVVTSDSTEWAHGLGGQDPLIEQITRHLFDRLAGDPDRSSGADRTQHGT